MNPFASARSSLFQLVLGLEQARLMHKAGSTSMLAPSINVQGLSGNYRYIEEQFEHGGFNVVMLQETKSPGGQCKSKRYYRLATEPQRHWGVAIWFSRRFGVLNIDGFPVPPDWLRGSQCDGPMCDPEVVVRDRPDRPVEDRHCLWTLPTRQQSE